MFAFRQNKNGIFERICEVLHTKGMVGKEEATHKVQGQN